MQRATARRQAFGGFPYPSPPLRVSEKRTRQAVDRLVTLQFDRHGDRLWDEAKALLDHEHARMRIGQVAVPFGICVEPSNVKAGGHACPFRFRCLGCDHTVSSRAAARASGRAVTRVAGVRMVSILGRYERAGAPP
ncbi:hypothetical protein [Streptomyces sp. NPDC060035]|uniref:hypothetical protein n=1 Tax=Streptomyces sp. NPDC060035 TaxID=3347044 RepID=UPI003674ABCE